MNKECIVIKGIYSILNNFIFNEEGINIKIKNKKIILHFSNRVLREAYDYSKLTKFCKKLKKVINQYKDREDLEIVILFEDVEVIDLSFYNILESLIYLLCLVCKFKNIKIKNQKIKNVYDLDMEDTIIAKYRNNKIKREDFIKIFHTPLIDKYRYRKILSFNTKKSDLLSILYTDLNLFLKYYSLSEEFIETFSEAISELVGNALEHAQSDCLVDLYITPLEDKETNKKHYKIEISVINFSDILLGNGISENLFLENVTKKLFVNDLKIAYTNHSKYFSEDYDSIDFFNISTFQWRFSGRKDLVEDNGGTGLTNLILFLINLSKLDTCYVLSGDRIIIFQKDLIESNDKKYVGFNKSKNYLTEIPDKKILGRTNFYLNGTLYNFSFLVEGVD